MLRITITNLDNGAEMLNQTTDCILASISNPENDSTIRVLQAANCTRRTLLAGFVSLLEISGKVSKELFGEV